MRFTANSNAKTVSLESIRRDGVSMLGVGSGFVCAFSERMNIVLLHQTVKTVVGTGNAVIGNDMV